MSFLNDVLHDGFFYPKDAISFSEHLWPDVNFKLTRQKQFPILYFGGIGGGSFQGGHTEKPEIPRHMLAKLFP